VIRRHLRLASVLLVAFGASCTLAFALPRTAAADHSCCDRSPAGLSGAASPCQGLLPLDCCDGTALPSAASEPPRHDGVSLVPPGTALASPPGLAPAPIPARSPAPPRPPLLRTVVLQL
jgi:hypothetical protein